MFKRVNQNENSHDLTMNPIIRLAMLATTIALALPLAAQTPSSALPDHLSLPGHVIRALANATRLPHAPEIDEEPITVTVVLNLSAPQGAKALEEEYSNPDSPNYHKTITVSEFTSRFAPSQDSFDTVLAYLEQNGLTVSHSTIDRMTMSVTGTRAQFQKAFHVTIDNYQLGDRTFRAVASDPIVPETIAPMIAAVAGLSTLARPHHFLNPSPPVPASLAKAYNGTLTPGGTTNTGGGLPPGLDGHGVTIGLLEDDGFDLSDVSNWLSFANLSANLVNHVHVYSAVSPSGCTPASTNCGTSEDLLDIAAAIGIAPGATIEVFESNLDSGSLATSLDDAIIELALKPRAVLSISLGYCEDGMSQADAAYIDEFAAVSLLYGVSIFASTGDTGATCAGTEPNTIPAPADSPHVVAVGGTKLNVSSTNSYNSESWWSVPGSAGGFGTSLYFAEPAYQTSRFPGAAGRSIPDVSMEAAFSVVICQPTCSYITGGTSLSAPLWAATWALLEQANFDAALSPTSAAHGYIYKLAAGLHAPGTMTGAGNDFRHVGLGSPDITKLIAIAVPPQIGSFSPLTGTQVGGTTVTIYGVGFIGVKSVTFGGYAGTNLKVESDVKLTIDTPFAHNNADAEVKVVTPGGTATASGKFDYDPLIDFVSDYLNPPGGPTAGGTTVTVSGVALSADMTFEFGGSTYKATNVSCTSHTSCTMLSPAHPAGKVNVRALAPWGYLTPVLAIDDQFIYQ
jgi:kumamolisin